MCGIFGYVGKRTAEPILIEGLRALEYRGYDSAGMFVPGYGAMKAVGPVENLAKLTKGAITGTSGIAHTRWATHGEPTEKNAHPHCDMSGHIWLVHNGIIENYEQLKEMLLVQGVTFTTDTDSEVLAKSIGLNYSGDLLQAVQETLSMAHGAYGIAVMHDSKPDEIVVARLGSPIVLGVASDAHFVSSDPSALLPHTKDVVYLEDGEIAVLSADSYRVVGKNGKSSKKESEKISWDVGKAQKEGYEHFMLKEIFEAPRVIENTIRGRLLVKSGRAKLGGLEAYFPEIEDVQHITITGCGSAYYAGLTGSYMLQEYARLPVSVVLASEYRYTAGYATGKSALLAISQSGETADTLAAVRRAKELGLTTLGVVNAVGSTIAREVDAGVHNHAGQEIAVASTKAFISQLAVLVLLTLHIGRERGMSEEEGRGIATALQELPAVLRNMLVDTSAIETVAKKYASYEHILFIGRTLHMPIAYEGALKLKEVSYIHAEAYAGGELKHGPLALLGPEFPVIALVPHDAVYEKMISNVTEVKSRCSPVLAVIDSHDVQIEKLADDCILMPRVHPIVQPIVTTVALHLLAYHIGVLRGCPVDKPRNLAKSVTVE